MTVFVIWDWDATLADTYPVTNAAYAYTFKKLGMEEQTISFDEVKRITSSLQNKDVLAHIFGEDKKENARKYFYEYISAKHAEKLEPIKGAYAALEYLATKKAVSLLLSNKTNTDKDGRGKYLSQETDKLNMTHYFSKIAGAGEEPEDKPSPIAIDALLNSSETKPSKDDLILVIGDGEADLKIADYLRSKGLKASSILLDPKNKYKGSTRPNYTIHELNTLPIILRNELDKTAEHARHRLTNTR